MEANGPFLPLHPLDPRGLCEVDVHGPKKRFTPISNVDTDQMVWLLLLLHRHFRRHVVLVWDRWNVHKSATAYLEKQHPGWFTFEPLPAYSPKLNPVEQCWNHTKYSDLPNFIPDDLDHLHRAVDAAITDQSENQKLLRSFFKYTKLTL